MISLSLSLLARLRRIIWNNLKLIPFAPSRCSSKELRCQWFLFIVSSHPSIVFTIIIILYLSHPFRHVYFSSCIVLGSQIRLAAPLPGQSFWLDWCYYRLLLDFSILWNFYYKCVYLLVNWNLRILFFSISICHRLIVVMVGTVCMCWQHLTNFHLFVQLYVPSSS